MIPRNIESRIERIPESGCWIWRGSLCKYGYGRMEINHKKLMVHRVVYEMSRGPIPDGLQLDHLCRVRCCINPDHLEVVTSQQNTLRGKSPAALNAKKTHCPHGHLLDRIAKGYSSKFRRICSTCNKKYLKNYHRKLKEAAELQQAADQEAQVKVRRLK